MTRALRGITWGHARGLDPLLECSRLFEATTGVGVDWEVRDLQGFADATVVDLARRYDLVVFDHPHLGEAVRFGALQPLTNLLTPGLLEDLAANSVGPSYASYLWEGETWGAPIDAAGTVAAWRPDLLGGPPPSTWEEFRAIASDLRSRGRWVATPMVPIDVLTVFITLISSTGADPFAGASPLPRESARAALGRMVEIAEVSHPMSLAANPVSVLDRMSTDDDIAYAPLVFGYSNYARPGYRQHLLEFGGFPADDGRSACGVLGGAGLGISAFSDHSAEASDFLAFVTSGPVQRGPYVRAGGQPGHRTAWLDQEANALANGYFLATLPVLDAQYLRPRYHGYLQVQSEGGRLLHSYLADGGDPERTLDDFDAILEHSRR